MITHHPGGSTTFTGEAIDYYRLCVLKSAVGLELKGIRIRRGPLVWPAVKREFGLTGNKDAVYAWLVAKVNELRQEQQHVQACHCKPDCQRWLPCDCACHEPELGEG